MKIKHQRFLRAVLALALCVPMTGGMMSSASAKKSRYEKRYGNHFCFKRCHDHQNPDDPVGPTVPDDTPDPTVPIVADPFYTMPKKSYFPRPKVMLNLPLCRQATNYTCGVACVQSVLRYANYDFDMRQDSLCEILQATPEIGTPSQNISYYLNNIRYDTDPEGTSYFNTHIEQNMTIADVESQLRAGNPVMLAIQAWNWNQETGEYEINLDYTNDWESGHYVIACGYDNNNIFFMDPSTAANYTYIPKSQLCARWHDIEEDGTIFNQAGLVVEMARSNHTLDEFYKIL